MVVRPRGWLPKPVDQGDADSREHEQGVDDDLPHDAGFGERRIRFAEIARLR
jgi:hypothetical protein